MPLYLPPEILGMIISWIFDIETLLALRLVDRGWRDIVDFYASQCLYVDIMSKNLKRLNDVLKTASLRNQVRTLVWNLPDRPMRRFRDFDIGSGAEAIKRQLLVTGFETLENLTQWKELFSGFPKLAHIALHFRPPPIRGKYPCLSYERAHHLSLMFEDAFGGFSGLRDLNELSIHSIPIELTFPRWANYMSSATSIGRIFEGLGLKSLQLGFVGPEVWPYEKNRKGKPTSVQPKSLVLFPIRHTLRHLSLSYWGCYMRNIPFHLEYDTQLPHLQSLELRGCGFTCSQPLLWILRHGDTLRSLKLDDCAIIYSLELVPKSKAEECYQVKLEVDGGQVYQIYHAVWAHWFRQLANGLPHLRRLEVGSSRVRAPGEEGPKFQSEASVGPKFGHTNPFLFGLFPDRYLEMKVGTSDIPWILRPRGQGRKFKDRPESDEEDLVTLRRLLQVTGQMVRENDTSNHAARVNNLMGSVEAV